MTDTPTPTPVPANLDIPTPLISSMFVHLRRGLVMAHRIEHGITHPDVTSAVVSIEATTDDSELLLVTAEPDAMHALAAHLVIAATNLDHHRAERANE